MIIAAPNGARRGKADHPNLPMNIEEIAAEAAACQQAGAAVLHLHVRDSNGAHSLDAGLYRAASEAIAISAPGMVVQITTEHPSKGEQTYEGVRLNALLDLAGLQTDAAMLNMIASDGYSADAPLADVQACADCLVAFHSSGDLRMVMPGMSSDAWVKKMIEIEIK